MWKHLESSLIFPRKEKNSSRVTCRQLYIAIGFNEYFSSQLVFYNSCLFLGKHKHKFLICYFPAPRHSFCLAEYATSSVRRVQAQTEDVIHLFWWILHLQHICTMLLGDTTKRLWCQHDSSRWNSRTDPNLVHCEVISLTRLQLTIHSFHNCLIARLAQELFI